MGVSRFRCAGVLLLVLWLVADLSALGFCAEETRAASTSSARVSADDESNGDAVPCCGAHHCFCCSSCAEVVKFELAFDARSAFMAATHQPRPADISAPDISPPPRS